MGFMKKKVLYFDSFKKGDRAYVIDALILATGESVTSKAKLFQNTSSQIVLSFNDFKQHDSITEMSSSKTPIEIKTERQFSQAYTVGLEFGIWSSTRSKFILSPLGLGYLKLRKKSIQAAVEYLYDHVFFNMFRFIDGKLTLVAQEFISEAVEKITKESMQTMSILKNATGTTLNTFFWIIARQKYASNVSGKSFNLDITKIKEKYNEAYYAKMKKTIESYNNLSSSNRKEIGEIIASDFSGSFNEFKAEILEKLRETGTIKGDTYTYVLKSNSYDMLRKFMKNANGDKTVFEYLEFPDINDSYSPIKGRTYTRQEISYFADNFNTRVGIMKSKSSEEFYITSKNVVVENGILSYEYEGNAPSKNGLTNNDIALRTAQTNIFAKVDKQFYIYLGKYRAIDYNSRFVLFNIGEMGSFIDSNVDEKTSENNEKVVISSPKTNIEELSDLFVTKRKSSDKTKTKPRQPKSKETADKARENAKVNGDKAETLTFQDLKNKVLSYKDIDDEEIKKYIERTHQIDDDAGYDFKYRDPESDKEFYIEVKSLMSSKNFFVSANEIRKAKKYGKKYKFAFVNKDKTILYTSSVDVLNHLEITPQTFSAVLRKEEQYHNIDKYFNLQK